MSDSLQHYRLYPTRLLCPWNSPGKKTGVGCHALLQGIFLTQGSNLSLLSLLHWQVGSLPLAPLQMAKFYSFCGRVVFHFTDFFILFSSYVNKGWIFYWGGYLVTPQDLDYQSVSACLTKTGWAPVMYQAWINSLGYNAEHDRDNCLSSQGWHSTGQCVLEVTPAYHQALLYRIKVTYSNPQPRKGCSPQMVKGPLWPQPAQLRASLGWKWWEVEGASGLKWTHWFCLQLCLSSWRCFYYYY